MGVRIVDKIAHEDLKFLFRPRERHDLGIDGEIEVVDERDGRRHGSGRLIAVQIKCGESFFTEATTDSFVFRGDPKHLAYWTDFSLPVLIVICDPTTREAYWVEFDPSAVTVLTNGWKIAIPKRNRLSRDRHSIEWIARRNAIDDVIDMSVQGWVHARHAKRVEICGIAQLPRDFPWYRHLISIGEETVALHWLYARYGSFEPQEVTEVLKRLKGNLEYASRMLLCLVADRREHFDQGPATMRQLSEQAGVECVRLIFQRAWSRIGELGEDGSVTWEYYRGQPEYREGPEGDWIG